MTCPTALSVSSGLSLLSSPVFSSSTGHTDVKLKKKKNSLRSNLTSNTFFVPVLLGELLLWHIALGEDEFQTAQRNPFSHKTLSVTAVIQNYVERKGFLPSLFYIVCVYLCACVCVNIKAERRRQRAGARQNCMHGPDISP